MEPGVAIHRKGLPRRHFLKVASLGVIGAYLAACAPAAPPTPESKPAAPPAEGAPKPAAPAPPAKGPVKVRVLVVGVAPEDGQNPITGRRFEGIPKLVPLARKELPDVDLEFISIPWGSGATHYSAKTQAMLLANEAELYQMPGVADFGLQGLIEDLQPHVMADKTFTDVWGGTYMKQWAVCLPGKPNVQLALPYHGDIRIIAYDKKLLDDFGVQHLSETPTLAELEEKGTRLTAKHPKTGQQIYGFWYRGKYTVGQYLTVEYAMRQDPEKGAWSVSAGCDWVFNFTDENALKALDWFMMMKKYTMDAALTAPGAPEGWLTDTNVVAIVPEENQGAMVAVRDRPELKDRIGFSFNIRNPKTNRGGWFVGSPIAMAKSAPDKDAAWAAIKWLAQSETSQRWNWVNYDIPPILKTSLEWPEVKAVPYAKVLVEQNANALPFEPWRGAQPRFILQTGLEEALTGKKTPSQALADIQKQCTDWMAERAKTKK